MQDICKLSIDTSFLYGKMYYINNKGDKIVAHLKSGPNSRIELDKVGFKALNNKRSYYGDYAIYNAAVAQYRAACKGYDLSDKVKNALGHIKYCLDRNSIDSLQAKARISELVSIYPEVLFYPLSLVKHPFEDKPAELIDVEEPFLPLASLAAMYRWDSVVEQALKNKDLCLKKDAVRGATLGMYIAMFYGHDCVNIQTDPKQKVSTKDEAIKFTNYIKQYCSHNEALLCQDVYGNNIAHYVAAEFAVPELIVYFATNPQLAEQVNDNGETFADVYRRINKLNFMELKRVDSNSAKSFKCLARDMGLSRQEIEQAAKVLQVPISGEVTDWVLEAQTNHGIERQW